MESVHAELSLFLGVWPCVLLIIAASKGRDALVTPVIISET